MPYGLTRETKEKINRVFAKYMAIDKAVLYGSRAKGNYTPGSDIDLVLKGKMLNLEQLNKINIDIDDLLLPYTFDLSIFHHMSNPDVIEHIKRVGKTFYKR